MSKCSTAVYAANNEPDENPPGAEEGDDTVQEMVRPVIHNVGSLSDLHVHT